ncbi:hypothetical protein PROFUN_02499 [Planoprotostelium fungivorum]|uniref:F-box domain-containing protein n=1 Tax=Planoprotostelium fungivorum TaxID=1890364 RepID=A0A2P6MP42_9EUKA|nr:hypothetical protein PROFUN_02499 [Planoprotostelium fungivorum]
MSEDTDAAKEVAMSDIPTDVVKEIMRLVDDSHLMPICFVSSTWKAIATEEIRSRYIIPSGVDYPCTHPDLVRWWASSIRPPTAQERSKIAGLNNVQLLRDVDALQNTEFIYSGDVCEVMIRHDNLEGLQYVIQLFEDSELSGGHIGEMYGELMTFCAKMDRFGLFRWMVEVAREKKWHIHSSVWRLVVQEFISRGNVEALQFAHKLGNTSFDNLGMALTAVTNNQLSTLKWLHSIGCHLSPILIETAAAAGHTHMIDFLRQIGMVCSSRVAEAAAVNGHLETLKTLVTSGCPWNMRECYLRCITFYNVDHLTEIIRWILEQKWTGEVFDLPWKDLTTREYEGLFEGETNRKRAKMVHDSL